MVISCFQNWSSDPKGIKRSKWRLSFSLNNRSGPPNWYSLLFENFKGWVHECIPISFILKVSHKLMSWKGVYSTFDNIWCLRNVPVVNWSGGLWLWPRDIYIKKEVCQTFESIFKRERGNYYIRAYISFIQHKTCPLQICCWIISNGLEKTHSRSLKLIMVS